MIFNKLQFETCPTPGLNLGHRSSLFCWAGSGSGCCVWRVWSGSMLKSYWTFLLPQQTIICLKISNDFNENFCVLINQSPRRWPHAALVGNEALNQSASNEELLLTVAFNNNNGGSSAAWYQLYQSFSRLATVRVWFIGGVVGSAWWWKTDGSSNHLPRTF